MKIGYYCPTKTGFYGNRRSLFTLKIGWIAEIRGDSRRDEAIKLLNYLLKRPRRGKCMARCREQISKNCSFLWQERLYLHDQDF
jgi:hypothetical protein